MSYDIEQLTDPGSNIFEQYMSDTPDYGLEELYIPLDPLPDTSAAHVEYQPVHTVFGKHTVTTYKRVITNRPVT